MDSKERQQERILLRRWKQIEAAEDLQTDDEQDASREDFAFTRLKEAWFLDAFSFLFGLPRNEHYWCGYRDLMRPLLEPFCHYFDDLGESSPLRVLWKRLSNELGSCIQCVLQHHKAKDFYATEFVEDIVEPLLSVLQVLDEERVAMHIKDITQRIEGKKLEVDKNSEELACVLFEVLMFPSLLEDAEISDLIIPFLKYVEATHELTLAENQHYPGVYALLFHPDQGARGIALRLAAVMGKLRTLSDLDSIQPILQTYMNMLEFDIYDPKDWALRVSKSKRNSTICPIISERRHRRASFTRESLWIGMKTLLGLLEPAIFEGIVDRYPSFISIVLNHVSEATPVFWNALHSLKLLLDALGFKLWLKTTFSPGVMRNTFLGQCFHTCEERIHKAIFDLFQPFLQSLEALQDGEYERQRRNILYFLLQQVPHSSNFSCLMSKKARQISFLIVERGYKMTPSCPPVECAHVWCPPLIESVKDTSLYTSIRQPALVLMQAIIISDTVGLTNLYSRKHLNDTYADFLELDDQDFDEHTEAEVVQVVEDSCWNDVKRFDKSSSTDWGQWHCIPLLWIDILEAINPLCLPASFSQAVLWSRSHVSVIFLGSELKSLGICAAAVSSTDIAIALQWEKPKGCDDGAGGKCCLNSVNAQIYHMQLLALLRRSTDHYVSRLHECGIVEQWIWNPVVSEILTLLLMESDERLRNFNRHILSHIVKDQGLDAGLAHLCSGKASAASVSSGLKYAIKAFMASDLTDNNQGLQQLFFISWKILTLGWKSSENKFVSQNSSNPLPSVEPGGFLKQVDYFNHIDWDTVKDRAQEMASVAVKLCYQLSYYLWPLILKTLTEGRQFAKDNMHLMTFARMFDLLPLVFRSVVQFSSKTMLQKLMNKRFTSSKISGRFWWLQILVDWGKVEQVVIHRRFKAAIISIMEDISKCISHLDPELINEAMKWLQKGLSLHQSSESGDFEKYNQDKENVARAKVTTVFMEDHAALNPTMSVWKPEIIDISDNEINEGELKVESLKKETSEVKLSQNVVTNRKSLLETQPNSGNELKEIALYDSLTANSGNDALEVSHGSLTRQSKMDKHPVSVLKASHSLFNSDRKITLDNYHNSMTNELLKPADLVGITVKNFCESTDAGKNINQLDTNDVESSGNLETPQLGNTKDVEIFTADRALVCRQGQNKAKVDLTQDSARMQSEKNLVDVIDLEGTESLSTSPSETKMESILMKLVSDSVDDPLESTLDAEKMQRASFLKTQVFYPKRQLIRLQLPNEQVRGTSQRVQGAFVRAPVRLDEWYKQILSMNYFYVIGMDCNASPEDLPAEPLIERPLVFQSAEHYVDVFRRFVLEEFKAQLQHAHEELLASDGTATGTLKMMSLEKVDMFQICRFTADPGKDGVAKTCIENDLLLLSLQPFENASQSVHVLAKVERRERDAKSKSVLLILKLFLHFNNSRLAKARRFMIDRSEWHAIKVMNITPQLREFQALSAVANNVFLPIILNPGSLSMRSSISQLQCMLQTEKPNFESISKSLQSQLQSDYNESQLKAIADVTRTRSGVCQHLSLVQGPPGTGKTRTIIGVVSVLLAISRSSSISTHLSDENFPKTVKCRTSSVGRIPLSEKAAFSRSWQDAMLARELNKELAPNILKRGCAEKQRRGRVLVCAQSNAAVDELVSRMIEGGLYDSYGHTFTPFLVRVGNGKNVHPTSLQVFIDTLVDERIEADNLSVDVESEETTKSVADELRSKVETVIEKIRLLETQRCQYLNNNLQKGDTFDKSHKVQISEEDGSFQTKENSFITDSLAQNETTLKAKLNFLYRQKRQFCSDLAFAEAKGRKLTEESRIRRQTIRKDIIKQAEVVLTTLSGCGGDIYTTCMESNTRENRKKSFEDVLFDAVVIDEAAQALEPATLIPLQLLRPDHPICVMVGDPKQLSATVLSQLSGMSLYECSMFERLQLGGYPVTLLSTQYRMHPEICKFPSAHFYQNQLINGDNLTEFGRFAAFHEHQHFRPYMFFDIVEGYEQINSNSFSQSLCNEAEVEFAFEMLTSLQRRYPEVVSRQFGVITPYKQQLSKLRKKFIHSFGQGFSTEIEFNTVDGFQGREVDILILSTVRASSKKANKSQFGGIGFVADVRRMNVALTRARFSLWIVGNANTLRGNPSWTDLIDDAKARGLFHTVRKPYKSFFINNPVHSSEESLASLHNRRNSHAIADDKVKSTFSRPSKISDGNLTTLHNQQISQEIPHNEVKSAFSMAPGNTADPKIKQMSLPNRHGKEDSNVCLSKESSIHAKKHKIRDVMGAEEAFLRGDRMNKKNKNSAVPMKPTEACHAAFPAVDQDREKEMQKLMDRTVGTPVSHNVGLKPSNIDGLVHRRDRNAAEPCPTSRLRSGSSTEVVEKITKKHRLNHQREYVSQSASENLLERKEEQAKRQNGEEKNVPPYSKNKENLLERKDERAKRQNGEEKNVPPYSKNKESCLCGDGKKRGETCCVAEQNRSQNSKDIQQLKVETNTGRLTMKENTISFGMSESKDINFISVSQGIVRVSSVDVSSQMCQDEKHGSQSVQKREFDSSRRHHQYPEGCNQAEGHQQEPVDGTDLSDDFSQLRNEWKQFEKALAELKKPIQHHG